MDLDLTAEYELPDGDLVKLVSSLPIPTDAPDASWGATVVPYCKCPDGTTYLLLGKEQPRGAFGTFPGQVVGQWCGFGGQHNNNENNVYKVAAREWAEENCGVVAPNEGVMFERLRQRQWLSRINICVNHGARDDVPRRYYTGYLVEIPWQPDAPRLFKDKTTRLWSLRKLFLEYQEAAAKASVVVGRRGVLAISHPSEADVTVTFCRHATARPMPYPHQHVCTAQCLTAADMLGDSYDGVEMDAASVQATALLARMHHLVRLFLLEEGFVDALRMCYVLQPTPEHPLLESIAGIDHGGSDGGLRLAGIPTVQPQYLEKECIEWFSVPRLWKWLQEPPSDAVHAAGARNSGGGRGTMRRNFRPMLDLMLREL